MTTQSCIFDLCLFFVCAQWHILENYPPRTCFSSIVRELATSVQMFLILIVLVTGQALALPAGGNESALPYLLRGGGKDVCLNKPTLKGKGECMQELLESYYGRNFTKTCSSLPLILAEHECKGCPWDLVNTSIVDPVGADKLNRSQLFHQPSASCMIAEHVERYGETRFIRSDVFHYGIYGTGLLFYASAYHTVSSTTETVIENGGKILGSKVSEPVFLMYLWLLYHFGNSLVVVSQDYVEFCEGEADKLFQEIARLSFYAILLWISLKRCRNLIAIGFNEDAQSWERYFESAGHRKRKRFLSGVFEYLLVLSYIGEIGYLGSALDSLFYNKSICYARAKSWQFFTIQLLKIMLELIAVIVYACGPSRKRGWFYLRYSMLMLTLFGGFFLFVLVVMGHNSVDVTYMMISRVADKKIALPFTNLVHVVCVSLLGLLEPIRIGWPGRLKNVRTVE